MLLLNITKISGHDINHSDNNNVCMGSEGNKPKWAYWSDSTSET